MKRFLKSVFLVLFGGALISIAIANRHNVRFVVDPFIDRDAAFAVNLPLFVYLFGAMFLGLIVGAMSMWIGQRHWRKMARSERKEAVTWKREAETLKRGLQGMPVPGAASVAQRLRIS